jgi:hypothetical protein
MFSAMGSNWGSNVERTTKARHQAAKVDTSGVAGELDDDEFTMA